LLKTCHLELIVCERKIFFLKLHVNGGKIIILTEAIRFCFMVGEKSYFFQWR